MTIQNRSHVLGVDIGSVSISVIEMDRKREIFRTAYEFHHGNINGTLRLMLKDFDLSRICGIASTTSTPAVIKTDAQYDNRISMISAALHFHEKVGAILIVGGEKFGLITFDENGNYLNFRSNTSCAAGTGSFLDQQAKRLNLNGIEELSELAFNNKGIIPKIATRCAVFAKTDLVHAQQEGCLLEEICDGLCSGLAKNIADTLFKGEKISPPLIFTGGVSRNRAVARHIQSITGMNIIVDEMSCLYGAVGAGLNLLDELNILKNQDINSVDDVLIHQPTEKKHYYEPLRLKLSDYPDFRSYNNYEYTASGTEDMYPVEVDIYNPLVPLHIYEVYMGIDIGSTSTKAVLMDRDRAVLAGFYTRTAGRPVHAVQKLFASIDDVIEKHDIHLKIIGAGTTGAGRKFSGKIIGADIIVDEITAHARAAFELDPGVDTIIEIGGQDSKFTTLRKGMVTFSAMNNVCAAGTGSFIEEQALKLRCPLSDYSSRAEGMRAPIASDRCTVFMERDINHYLSEGYSVDEVLASALHSIRENYLTKVAIESSIGSNICFQGATAKNKALVAAFEQRLNRPIHVSPYCHLTGALGVALMLNEQGAEESTFKGLQLYKREMPVRSEVCEICTNHCKITIADVDGESVAYGFLCGRDYDTKKYINNNLSGFDLLKERKKVLSFNPSREFMTIGIPSALHLYEDLPMWKYFFDQLSVKTMTSDTYTDAVKEGKRIAGAEFCAPLTALHGHVKYLLDRADYIFMPFYLEMKQDEKNVRRQFCYYTQFSSSLVAGISPSGRNRFLMPLVNYLYNPVHTKVQLYNILKPVMNHDISYLDVARSYDRALEFKESCSSKLKELYKKESLGSDDIHVVFIGRPYSILPASMNSGIPGIFASQGIRTFYQDMLSYTRNDVEAIEPLCNELPWHYASEILKAADVVARTDRAYPVYVTSFKCSPDSFAVEYFKKLMESHEKPYLILQLDEHSSSVGYETRIEAAVRSFRNHYSAHKSDRTKTPVIYAPPLIPAKKNQFTGKTLLIPNWDSVSMPLIIANLKSEGIDARLLEETNTSIQKSLRLNSGQCIPLNIIAQEFIDYVEKHDLDPANTVLWIMTTTLACNLKMFPHHIKNIFHSYGRGMSSAEVYTGSMSFADLSIKLPINSYFAYMFGGLVRKMGCRIRPYEKEKGKTDRMIKKSIDVLADSFLGSRSKESAVAEVVSYFEDIEVVHEPRPKIAVFGDLYVRDNEVMNQDLVHFIEDNGGEVIMTPFSSFLKMISGQYFRKWFIEGQYLNVLSTKTFFATATMLEKTYYKYFERILKEPDPEYDESPEKILSEYNIRVENTGESMDNIMKIHYIKKHYPDVALFVQASPAFCCPSLITEAMSKEIEKKTGTPVVSITYDGTGGNKNDIIIPYIRYSEYKHHNPASSTLPCALP
ncbi:MAG: CoA activase [Nitrospiraceae bacterium]|nr:MAG: CoA activase [Nitrospiraceae bacterium]